jgi:hypothetical protein
VQVGAGFVDVTQAPEHQQRGDADDRQQRAENEKQLAPKRKRASETSDPMNHEVPLAWELSDRAPADQGTS